MNSDVSREAETRCIRHRSWLWALAGTVLIVAGAFVTWRLMFRDSREPISVADAVSTYRAQSTPARARPGSGVRLPSPGVYVFRTEGAERIAGTPLGSANHVYPARTAVIITRDGCGFLEQWTPLKGRSRAVALCSGPRGWTVTRAVDRRTFFSIEVPREFTCPGGVLKTPLGTSRRESWSSTCQASGFSTFAETARSRLVGRETLNVGGRRIAAVHVRDDLRLRGGTRGRAVRETWRRATDGLLLRLQYREKSVMSTHVGDVSLGDRYRLELSSLTPRH